MKKKHSTSYAFENYQYFANSIKNTVTGKVIIWEKRFMVPRLQFKQKKA